MMEQYEYQLQEEEVTLLKHPFSILKKVPMAEFLAIYVRSWVFVIVTALVAGMLQQELDVPVFSILFPVVFLAELVVLFLFYLRKSCLRAIITFIVKRQVKEKGWTLDGQNMGVKLLLRQKKLIFLILKDRNQSS